MSNLLWALDVGGSVCLFGERTYDARQVQTEPIDHGQLETEPVDMLLGEHSEEATLLGNSAD